MVRRFKGSWNYDVGYKKPPEKSRFKKGNKEHLKRRKRSLPDVKRVYLEVISKPIAVIKNGRRVKLTRMKVIVDNLFADAIAGKVQAAQNLIVMYDRYREMSEQVPKGRYIFSALDEEL